MSALTSLLVRDHVVSVRKIEEAIQRQVMSGGELETVLLEMDAVPEDVMSAYRAALYGLLPATRDEVMRVPRDTVKLVPRDVALQYRLVPLWAEKRTLVVAVTEPLKPEVDEQLGFLLGHELVYRIVTEARLVSALGQHYDADVAPRIRRLAEKLRQRDPGVVAYVAPPQEEKLDPDTGEIPRKKQSDLPSMINWDEEDDDAEDRVPTEKQLQVPPPAAVPKTSSKPASVAPVVGVGPGTSPSRPPPSAATTTRTPSAAGRRAVKASSPLLRKLRGPLTPAAAVELLDEATDRDEILEVFFTFSRQFFDWAALFVVHDDVADGREAWGAGLDAEQITRIAVPLDVPGSFGQVRQAGQPSVIDLGATEPDRVVAGELGRADTQPSLIVPVVIRGRVVILFYGDRAGERFGIADVPELIAFLPRVADAFQKLILKKKLGGYGGSGGGSPGKAQLKSAARKMGASPPVKDAAAFRPPPGEGAARLVTALGSSPGSEPAPSPRATSKSPKESEESPGPAARARKPSVRGLEDPLGVLGVPRSAPPPPMRTARTSGTTLAPVDEDDWDTGKVEKTTRPDGKAPEVVKSARAAFAQPRREPVGEGLDEPEIAVGPFPEDDPALAEIARANDDDGWESEIVGSPTPQGGGAYIVHDGRVDVVGGGRRRASDRPEPRRSDAPREKRRTTNRPPKLRTRSDPRREEDAGAVLQEVVRVRREASVPPPIEEAPPPRRERRGSPVSEPAPNEPTVIVDMGDTVETLVDDLVQCGPDDEGGAVDALLHVGEASLPALVQRFPGPLWFDRRQPHRRLPRGRDVSAVARAIVSFGDRAVPYVVSLIASRDAEVRFYATLLATELVSRELLAPLSQRVFDEDEGTRGLALDVLRLFSRWDRDVEEMLKAIRIEARVDRGDETRRLVAVRALGELRDGRALELLVDLLDDSNPRVATAAHRALVTITRQDFGDSLRRWAQWVEKNKSRHRIEWLIDGLVHSDETIRASAGEELKALTQQYYGYHPASPKRDREIAQRKYKAWWDKEGQRAFGG